MSTLNAGLTATKFPLLARNAPDFETLVAVVRRLSIARSLQEIMEIVTTRTLLDADGITFVLRDGDWCHYALEDAIAPLWKGRRFPMNACISGYCMAERKAVVIGNIYEDPRVPHDAYLPTFVRSLAMVPVRQDDPIAAMGAYWSTVRQPSSAELEALQAIANAASLAIAKIELAQEQERARLREREAAHRYTNMLTVVVGIARLTARRSTDLTSFSDSFFKRLDGLARSQALLMESRGDGTGLHRLIREHAVFGEDDDGRVEARGPDIVLPPDLAFDVGLVLHELYTNALKHGALSCDGGRVIVEWDPASDGERELLRLSWREAGGPPVKPPESNGFGSTLIRHAFDGHDGTASIRFAPEGLFCEVTVPLR